MTKLKWNKITDKKPKENQEIVVYNQEEYYDTELLFMSKYIGKFYDNIKYYGMTVGRCRCPDRKLLRFTHWIDISGIGDGERKYDKRYEVKKASKKSADNVLDDHNSFLENLIRNVRTGR